jgi:integrase/recombinase XerD
MSKQVQKPGTPQYTVLLENYHKHTGIVGYSENGRKMKQSNISEFLVWLEKEEISNINKVQPHHIKEHYEYLKNRPHKKQEGVLSMKTITGHMHDIRMFFAWLQERRTIVTNPMSTLKFNYPKAGKNPRTVLTIAEIKELYRVTETQQERAILSLAYGCGLRSMEVTAVNLDDIRFNEGILIVPKGKGNKRRVIPMNRRIEQDLKNYMYNERYLYQKDDNEKAFILNIKGDRMRKYTVRKILSRIIARIGNQTIIEKNISTHNLRHSIATHLLEQGVAVEQVRNFLGHAHLETTEIYTRVSQEQLKSLMNKP